MESEQARPCVNSAINIKEVTEVFGTVYDTGWQNVIRRKQNTANVHSENNCKWTWLQIFRSPSPSASPACPDSSPSPDTIQVCSLACRVATLSANGLP